MITLNQAQSIHELRAAYHQLAKTFHPDCGGSNQAMLQLNHAYQHRKKILSNKQKSFYDLKIGDTIFINKTEAVVILVSQSKFVARAKGRSKQAWFDISTGIGIDYPYYQASFNRYTFIK